MPAAPAIPPEAAGVTPAPPPDPKDLPEQIEADRAWSLVYGAGLPPDLSNPNLRGNGWNEATALVYSRLYQVGMGGEIEPDLVERHMVEDDGHTWRIRLRRGVTWHDGTPLTIKDVRASLERVLDPEGGSDLGLNLPMVKSVEYPGLQTFIIRLHHPFPLLTVPLAEIAILPAGDPTGSTIQGSGPYKYVRHREDGSLEMHAHLPFHLGRPSIPRILLQHIPDDKARAEAVATGRVDFAHVKAQHVQKIRRRSNIWVARMTTGAWRGMPLNLNRPDLQDVRVRRAIDLALDRGQIVVNALPRSGRPAYQPVPPASWAFSKDLDDSYHDPNRAMKLLDEAGWFAATDGLRYRGRNPKVDVAAVIPASLGPGTPLFAAREEDDSGPLTLRLIIWKDEAFRLRAGQMIRAQLRRVGIKVELELVDNATYGKLADDMGDTYDGFIGGWSSLHDPGDNLYKKFHSRGSQNYMGYSNERVDRMLETIRATADPEAARELYARLMEVLRREAVFLPLAYPDYLFAARTRVAGFQEGVTDSWYEFSRHAWRWKLIQD